MRAIVAGSAVVVSLLFATDVLAQSTARATSSPTSGNATTIYDRAARNWKALKTVEATFDQRIHNSLLNRTATSRGTFMQQRPNLVNITFIDPAGDRIVGDGKWLWVYLPSSTPGQVVRLPADAEGAVVSDMLGQLLDSPRASFTITGGEAATIEGRATHRVQLVPRDRATATFQRASLWIDDSESRPVRVQLLDAQGVDRTITLTSWKPNATLSRTAFQFSVPRGVKIVNRMPGT